MSEQSFTTGTIREFDREAVEESRTVEFVISDSSRDRYHTRCNTQGWQLEQFNRNGIVGYQHNVYGDMCNAPNPDDVIGKGRAWIEGDQLIGSVEFEPADMNPLAEKIFRKILHGTLNATSVGFSPLAGENGKYGYWGDVDEAMGEQNETYYFYGQELLEFSIVNIPANGNALKRSVRDQSAHALMYLRRATGMSFADIENMTVRDVIGALEGKTLDVEPETLDVTLDVPTPEVTPHAAPQVDVRSALLEAMYGTKEQQVKRALTEALFN